MVNEANENVTLENMVETETELANPPTNMASANSGVSTLADPDPEDVFEAYISTYEIGRGIDMTSKLEYSLRDIESAISTLQTDKADTAHTHDGYVSQSDLETLSDVVDAKADATHTHTEYASSVHTHDDYVTVTAFDTLTDTVNGKADASHTHTEYSPISHTHTEYADASHVHDNYALISHSHSNYAETTHEHDNYALSTHAHTASEIGAASSEHNHDSAYANISHNHDGAYATVGHDHNEDYATIDHVHSDYATTTSLNNLSTIVSNKANASHSHDDVYYTEAEIDTKLASKADSSHMHTDVYDAIGSAASALTSANAYTDSKIDVLVGDGASTTLDTIGEISSAIENNQDAIDLLNSAIANKANVVDLNSHASDMELHITESERIAWNAKSDFSGNYSDLTNKPTIPSIDGLATEIYVDAQIDAIVIPNALSDLTTDSTHRVVTDAEKTAWNAKSNFSGSYNDLIDKPSIPSISGLATENYVDEVVSVKADNVHTHTVSDVTGLQVALDGKAASSHGTHVTYSTTAPVMDGTASVGTASTVARSDHKHPIDTSRASKTEFDTHASDTTKHITSTERTNWGTAYTHSQVAHAPSDAQKNQNAFSYVKVGETSVAADTTTDTITLVAGTNVTITPDATNDKITISATDTNTTYSAGTGISLSGTTFSNSGVRSIATGSANGTISVNTNGTSANVAVKGLGSAAYTASTAYDAAGTAQTKADAALVSAKAYADEIKNDLLNGAGAAYDTLKELGDLIDVNVDAIDALETVAASKANASDLTSHTSNKSNPHGVTLAQLGVTATASELNKLDGVTATTAELNIMDGVTATTAEINYLDGVTSNIQAQLDGKSSTSHSHSVATTSAAGLMSASDKAKLNGIASGANAYTLPTASSTLGGVKTTSTVTSASGYTACPIISGVPYYKDTNTTYNLGSFGITATAAELNALDGITATVTELNYVDGVTSNIQTQLNAKASSSHTHNYAGSSSAGGAATSANKLNTNAGSATQPVYFANGIPVKTTYTLGASVPSGAKFTDTTYSAVTTSANGLMIASDKSKLDGMVLATVSEVETYLGI